MRPRRDNPQLISLSAGSGDGARKDVSNLEDGSDSDCQLPPEHYRWHAKTVNQSEVAETDYADSSRSSLARMERLWHL